MILIDVSVNIIFYYVYEEKYHRNFKEWKCLVLPDTIAAVLVIESKLYFHFSRVISVYLKTWMLIDWCILVTKNQKKFNHQINDIIDEAMSQFGFPICKVAEPFVDIKIVHSSIPELRGFVGINQIFIHADNFEEKIKEFKGSQGLLQQVARMDIISLVIHELAHTRLMRVRN